jgi:signal transduction histidine kinase
MEFTSADKVATIVLWNFSALLVNVIAFFIMYMKANKNDSLRAFFLVQGAMIIWLVGKVLKTVSPNVELRWFFIVFYYCGICLLEVAFFEFAYIYYKQKKLNKKIKFILYFFCLIQIIFIAANPLHHKFYKIYGFWGDDFGSFFYVHVVINYLFILAGMIMCSIKFKRQIKDKKLYERNLITMAILLPLIFNFIYITRTLEAIFDYFEIQIFDITPIVYTWSLLVFVYSTFKYEFFYVNPIMKHEISQKLENPVLILDKNYQKIYRNSQFELCLETYLEKIVDHIQSNDGQVLKVGDQYYSYDVNKYKKYGFKKYIICFTDVTSYNHAKHAIDMENQEIALSNEKLENQIQMLKQTSVVGARNYIARELHDILGHALVVTIKLLEVSKVYYKSNKERTLESLKSATESLKKGFFNMKTIREKDSTLVYTTMSLEKEIKSMLRIVTISGMKSNFYMRGRQISLDEKIYDTIKKVTTELVTNTLKHSKASNLLLSISVTEDELLLQTMDNGQGIEGLKKGNGLRGIDGRLTLVGGNAKYTTEVGDGFMTTISIPL